MCARRARLFPPDTVAAPSPRSAGDGSRRAPASSGRGKRAFSATRCAATPDTPVSISSKISASTPSFSAKTFLSASMMRESSPPEAMRLIGPSASPAFADMTKLTSSAPEADRAFFPSRERSRTSKRTDGMLRSRSSPTTRSSSRFAAACRISVSARAFFSASAYAFAVSFSSCASRSPAYSSSSRRRSESARSAASPSSSVEYFFFPDAAAGRAFPPAGHIRPGESPEAAAFAQPLGSVLQREPRRADDLFGLHKIGAPRAGTGNIILRIAALCNSAAV